MKRGSEIYRTNILNATYPEVESTVERGKIGQENEDKLKLKLFKGRFSTIFLYRMVSQ